MNTILIGDIHLKSRLILPLVDEIIERYNIQRVIFLGDYTDFPGQQKNVKLYARDLINLSEWKYNKLKKNIEVINLIGNHDIYYYLGSPASFSLKDEEAFWSIGEFLEELNLQVAYQLDEYIVSHAGYNQFFNPEQWHFEPLTLEKSDGLEKLANSIGPLRGGSSPGGSPVWADYQELINHPNLNITKQIVGHTPVRNIDINQNIISIDTFAVDNQLILYGNGSILLYNKCKKLHPIKTNWKSVNTLINLQQLLH
ncbi:phosphoesterase [Macrococcoides caseolyticum]|uniref:metallophosphoesterase family protein n=1 Tax=Macrococcoides caseolyticum TaxID=69966 RepID=UPI000C34E024|nr:metallophosphoesterase family protein [Macrococcus caseolyticus]PKE06633.1 phosphoesterase [Macrococcus caseolyticus]PKE24406.1 phosphoesterase [Macrococcus caseolyticus]PKE53648.1 phosphoesterase [Macrococcus caseolyticus]PKF38791.1 phosphoesterase [Macrococcus caseolyticus]